MRFENVSAAYTERQGSSDLEMQEMEFPCSCGGGEANQITANATQYIIEAKRTKKDSNRHTKTV